MHVLDGEALLVSSYEVVVAVAGQGGTSVEEKAKLTLYAMGRDGDVENAGRFRFPLA
jgi:hypothetical protein